jgi:hypothetical protein
MQGAENTTAEEFFSRLVASVQVLSDASHRHASAGDSVGALACALGADVASLQAVLWERLNIASSAPQRRYFQAAESLTAALGTADLPLDSGSAAEALRAARQAMSEQFDEAISSDVADRWPDLAYLEQLAGPTADDVRSARERRLDGLEPVDFIETRRAAADLTMREAQESRIRADVAGAVRSAYQADFLRLESYLVESALAAGDVDLFTVMIRWELVASAFSELSGLPDEFGAAVSVIRRTFAGALGQGDGPRFLATLAPV